MFMRRLVMVAICVAAPAGFTPASASTLEEKDAYFESCKTEFVNRNMGDDNAAVAYCYPKAYGNETSGGGPPERTTYPFPGNQCYGDAWECNPYVRPN